MTLPTPSQTVGPFYGYALPFPGGGDIAPAGHPDAVTVHGRVFDGEGRPIPDALLEFWQPDPAGSRTGRPGSLRRDPVTGGFLGRHGVDFTGFGRVATDADGHYTLRTLPPGGAPYLSVCVFARGLLHHLFTRAYLTDHPLYGGDPLLASLDGARRASLEAVREDGRTHRFDIHLQGEKETTFLVFD
ncbi:protocatechuate 3,4-dioxygenase subunit alpha [Streptacidiphilus rugosus]|uniref:protocatechuate 3,4-dioxygenase subunit alpha n=1 Tax=Streptacidiphilus rugosus TaxID=405783 RepID=UPI000563F770|nr:protocatechuate 3,4-dioxygenase subunit alpha [Streptacidiphilus rugosus]